MTATVTVASQAIRTLSKPVSFFHVVKASFLKEFHITLRYRANLIANQIQSLMFIGMFALMATAFAFNTETPLSFEQTIVFFLSGLIIVFFDGVALWKPINSVNRDLYNGTLEYLFFNPHSRVAYFIGNILTSATFASIFMVPLMVALVWLSGLNFVSFLYVLAAIILTVSVLVAFGVMISLMAIMYKQTSNLAGILNTLFTFLSGFLFPISILPEPILGISLLLPYTYGIDLIRHYTLGSAWETFLPLNMTWGLLGGFAVIYWIIALFLLKRVEIFAKQQGLHLI
ncbi:MAG: ABC transporter permease [Methanobacteriota archaeon]|nr:MAG: ABC transporter permease [Euryarchaeota archaeon]